MQTIIGALRSHSYYKTRAARFKVGGSGLLTGVLAIDWLAVAQVCPADHLARSLRSLIPDADDPNGHWIS